MKRRELEIARDRLRGAAHVVVFTGAGMSAESGIPTFRDPGGIWDRFPPDRFATLAGLAGVYRDSPDELRRFLYEGLASLVSARPNPGHLAVADLERRTTVTVITQNIDGLHQRAGSRTVHELHGSMFRRNCTRCRYARDVEFAELEAAVGGLKDPLPSRFGHRRLLRVIGSLCPRCPACRGRMRPTVVLFEELVPLDAWQAAESAATECDAMLIVGTSATVQPAASLPLRAHEHGAQIVVVNNDAGARLAWADVNLIAPAAEVLPNLL